MIIDYSPLWDTLEKKGLSRYHLIKMGLNENTLQRLRRNDNITLFTLANICKIVNCTPNEVVRFIEEPGDTQQREISLLMKQLESMVGKNDPKFDDVYNKITELNQQLKDIDTPQDSKDNKSEQTKELSRRRL